VDATHGVLPSAAGGSAVLAAGLGGEHWTAGRGDFVPEPALQAGSAANLPGYTNCELLHAAASSIPGNSQLAVPAFQYAWPASPHLRIGIYVLLNLQIVKQAGSRIRIGIGKHVMVVFQDL